VSWSRLNVFVNAPIDRAYEPLFEALVFAIHACGYRARTALEESDSGDIRIEKLIQLIRECPRSIHDLSRDETPRFNMPFELGLALGAKRFGRRPRDRIKILIRRQHGLPRYLSDLAGNDPEAHNDRPKKIIEITRNFLHQSPARRVLPGPAHLIDVFAKFRKRLPEIAGEIDCTPDEVRAYRHYPTFVHCLTTFLTTPDRE
jgi:hypothetical protein